MGKIATIELIESVVDHPNADKLSICKIIGFQCITKKDQFKVGEKIIFVRPDNVFPEMEWAIEYRRYSPKRIKPIRLRSEWSEGVILPLEILNNFGSFIDFNIGIKFTWNNQTIDLEIGTEVSEILGITHYEIPEPQDISFKGRLPFNIPKTDEERFENINNLPYGEIVDVQLKVDGQSCSYYYDYETKIFGVLGRSLEIKEDTINNYTKNISIYDIKNKLIEYCENEKISLVIRGESYGDGIQGHKYNHHSKMKKGWAMFSVFLIQEHKYAEKGHKYYFINVAKDINLPIAPIIEENVILTQELVKKYSLEINEIDGIPFEGVVIKTPKDSFKIINKYYDSLK